MAKGKKEEKYVGMTPYRSEELAFAMQEFANKSFAELTFKEKIVLEIQSTQLKMERFVSGESARRPLIDFIDELIVNIGVSRKQIADQLDMNESNLRKYLVGKLRFTNDFAIKFADLFGLDPELLIHVQVRNDMLELSRHSSTKVIIKQQVGWIPKQAAAG